MQQHKQCLPGVNDLVCHGIMQYLEFVNGILLWQQMNTILNGF